MDEHRLREEERILRRHVTDRRWRRMHDVLDMRSRYLAVAVEDVFQPHNGSAVLRSCDAFGVQDVHIIENRNRYRTNPGVELGTAQWLSLYRYSSPHLKEVAETARVLTETTAEPALPGTDEALRTLRRLGYRIVATTPHRDDVTLEEFSLEAGPAVLLLGTEKEGLSEAALHRADEYLRIPMRGFVESLNISVSAAICLQTLSARLRATDLPWRLSAYERLLILNRWLRHSVRNADLIVDRELD
ncbi:MAG: RNA methyltransferase [Spirochaetales bacterium]|nr:RNA methyltransferase [Spirochaetales bacterium]